MTTLTGFDKEDYLIDVIFDEPVIGGKNLACNDARVYRLQSQTFLNITQGRRSERKKGTNDRLFVLPGTEVSNSGEGSCLNNLSVSCILRVI